MLLHRRRASTIPATALRLQAHLRRDTHPLRDHLPMATEHPRLRDMPKSTLKGMLNSMHRPQDHLPTDTEDSLKDNMGMGLQADRPRDGSNTLGNIGDIKTPDGQNQVGCGLGRYTGNDYRDGTSLGWVGEGL